MQRGKHETEFANDEVSESYDADEQQPRGTSQLHGLSRLNLSDFAPHNKADQRLDSCEPCGTVIRFSRITKRRESPQPTSLLATDLRRLNDQQISPSLQNER